MVDGKRPSSWRQAVPRPIDRAHPMPLHLTTYDIADPKRLRRVARLCERFGARVQESVFLMELEPHEWQRMVQGIARIVDSESDTVRYIPVCRADLSHSRGLGLNHGLRQAPGHWVV